MTTRVCGQVGCPKILTDGSTKCAAHAARPKDTRPSASARGYDSKWRRNSARFLKAHPVCAWPGCSKPSEHADHWPMSRRELVAAGVEHPDAWQHLRPLCASHHNSRSARERR
jgi:5-methylcytosine-specific restriction protein A